MQHDPFKPDRAQQPFMPDQAAQQPFMPDRPAQQPPMPGMPSAEVPHPGQAMKPAPEAKPPRKKLGIFRIYFIVCGVAVNIYVLIWLLIQLFTRLGNVLPKP